MIGLRATMPPPLPAAARRRWPSTLTDWSRRAPANPAWCGVANISRMYAHRNPRNPPRNRAAAP